MQFRVVWDQLDACAYLPDRVARLPLRVPIGPMSPEDLDRRLALGERRSGSFVYRTQCPACTACEPLRVPVARFAPTASQRRSVRRNADEVRMEVGPPAVSAERLLLYNRHKRERGLSRGDAPLSKSGYIASFVDTCVDTQEVRYLVGERLIGVSLLDIGRTSASSVYHYFDPSESRRSLGVYSVLAEIAWCAARGLEWYYLGLYVQACSHLAYKASYWPHQRRVAGKWREFTEPAPAPP